jgi:hypothetical protein
MSAPAQVPEKGFYVHYKHDPKLAPHDHMYEVVGLARNTEEQTYSVLYRPLYENDWFLPATHQSRPLEMFMESVDVGGVTVPRFTRIVDPELVRELTIVRDRMYPRG